MQLVLATNNTDKIREIRHLLDDLPITIMTRDDFLDFPDPDETGFTLEDNARLKARAISEFTGLPALADDSGLEVDALAGAPGVYSSRRVALITTMPIIASTVPITSRRLSRSPRMKIPSSSAITTRERFRKAASEGSIICTPSQ